MKALDDDFTVFKKLENTPVSRSFPTKEKLINSKDLQQGQINIQAVHILQKVLQEGSIPFAREIPGILHCYEMGWVHSEPIDADAADIVCVFPSRLHAK